LFHLKREGKKLVKEISVVKKLTLGRRFRWNQWASRVWKDGELTFSAGMSQDILTSGLSKRKRD